MLYILWGEDRFSLEETLQEIKKGLGDMSLLFTSTSVLEGRKLTVNELKLVGEAAPFLSSKRLVVKGLLERFEPEAKSSQPEKNRKPEAKKDSYPPPVARLKEICRSLFETARPLRPAAFTAFLLRISFEN